MIVLQCGQLGPEGFAVRGFELGFVIVIQVGPTDLQTGGGNAGFCHHRCCGGCLLLLDIVEHHAYGVQILAAVPGIHVASPRDREKGPDAEGDFLLERVSVSSFKCGLFRHAIPASLDSGHYGSGGFGDGLKRCSQQSQQDN
ncbi:hypothetical protein D3C75_645190 [compost metagenome]